LCCSLLFVRCVFYFLCLCVCCCWLLDSFDRSLCSGLGWFFVVWCVVGWGWGWLGWGVQGGDCKGFRLRTLALSFSANYYMSTKTTCQIQDACYVRGRSSVPVTLADYLYRKCGEKRYFDPPTQKCVANEAHDFDSGSKGGRTMCTRVLIKRSDCLCSVKQGGPRFEV